MISGLAIGILIGTITGTVALVLLKTAISPLSGTGPSILALTSELLAIPTFWFGGPWAATKLMGAIPLETMINPYVGSLATTFTLMTAYPLFRWITQLGKEFGRGME